MQADSKTQAVYKFKNTCHHCFSVIEIPLVSDFAYGELIFQTKDGQNFYLATLIGNETFDLIGYTLGSDTSLRKRKIDAQKVLILLADKPNGKAFTTDYPICPVCKTTQRHFNDNIRTVAIEIPFVTWNQFDRLTMEDKISRIKETAESIT